MREYIQYPQDIPVETELGTVLVSVTDGKHIYVTTPALNVGPLLTVRGASYYVSAHWYRDPADRTMHTGIDAVARGLAPEDTFGLYVSREGSNTVTQAARRSIEGAIQAALDDWAESPETDVYFAEGALAHSNNALRDLEQKEAELADELKVISQAIKRERVSVEVYGKELAKLEHPAGKGAS